jgi:hypothetical protein
MGSVGLTERAGGGSRSSTVACVLSVMGSLERGVTYATVFVRPHGLIIAVGLYFCGRHVLERACQGTNCECESAHRISDQAGMRALIAHARANGELKRRHVKTWPIPVADMSNVRSLRYTKRSVLRLRPCCGCVHTWRCARPHTYKTLTTTPLSARLFA